MRLKLRRRRRRRRSKFCRVISVSKRPSGASFFVGDDGMSLRKVGISGFRFFVARKKDVFEGDNEKRP